MFLEPMPHVLARRGDRRIMRSVTGSVTIPSFPAFLSTPGALPSNNPAPEESAVPSRHFINLPNKAGAVLSGSSSRISGIDGYCPSLLVREEVSVVRKTPEFAIKDKTRRLE